MVCFISCYSLLIHSLLNCADCIWRAENRKALLRFLFLLHFDLANEQAWTRRRDRYPAGLRTADTVECFAIIACCDDTFECRERRSDEIDAANEFIRTAIGINAIDKDRQHVERIRDRTARQRKSAFDLLEPDA